MWTQIGPFVEAENAYRREQVMALYPRTTRHPRGRFSLERPNWLGRPAHHRLGPATSRSVGHSAPIV